MNQPLIQKQTNHFGSLQNYIFQSIHLDKNIVLLFFFYTDSATKPDTVFTYH